MSNPPLECAARYDRSVPVGLERVWENVLDWEHLPWLHDGSFGAIECLDAGDWGWRARVRGADHDRELLVELCITDRAAGRYVSRTLEGPGAGSEVRTALAPESRGRTRVEVEFWLPVAPAERLSRRGRALVELYTRLWDEDERMMVEREARLRERAAPAAGSDGPLALGDAAALRARLPLPVDWGGRRFRIVEVDGELVVHATVCPHRLGPLGDAPVEAGRIVCPWHGYAFDVRSGRCDAQRLRLPPAPEVAIENGRAWLRGPRSSIRPFPGD